MAATLADRSALPFHLGITEPVDEATITGDPAIDGSYDPVEQTWKLPDGTPLTAAPNAYNGTLTRCLSGGVWTVDDAHLDPG